MEEPEKSWIIKLLDNWKAITATILIITTTALAIRTAFWEYDDKAREREKRLKEENRTEDNLQQAYFINQIIKKQFDSLRVEIAQSNHFFYSNSIKKDSLLMIGYPQISSEISRLRQDNVKINQKLNLIIDGQPSSDKIDFIKLLNERDEAANEKARRDSIDMILLREIRNINKGLFQDRPKFGDRVK